MVSAEAIQAKQDATRGTWGRAVGAPIVNVGESERLVSQVGGGILLGAGLLKGGAKGLALAGLGGLLLARGLSGHCHLYHALGADTADHGPSDSVPAQAGVRVEESVLIDRPHDELFRFWRDYANLSRFMTNVESVTALSGDRSHWVVRGPFGTKLEYDAEIHNETPGELIAWRSLDGGDLQTAGSVHFTPATGGRGTLVRVNQKFNPPGGQLGVAVSRLLGDDPASITRENLSRLKRLMEAGELPTVEGQSSGRE